MAEGLTMTKPKKIRWHSLVGFMARVTRKDGRMLAISVLSPDGDEWLATGAETSSKPESMQAVFDDHGHADLGAFDSLTDARAECEHYALHWREGEGDVIPACECEDIADADELERERRRTLDAQRHLPPPELGQRELTPRQQRIMDRLGPEGLDVLMPDPPDELAPGPKPPKT